MCVCVCVCVFKDGNSSVKETLSWRSGGRRGRRKKEIFINTRERKEYLIVKVVSVGA